MSFQFAEVFALDAGILSKDVLAEGMEVFALCGNLIKGWGIPVEEHLLFFFSYFYFKSTGCHGFAWRFLRPYVPTIMWWRNGCEERTQAGAIPGHIYGKPGRC